MNWTYIRGAYFAFTYITKLATFTATRMTSVFRQVNRSLMILDMFLVRTSASSLSDVGRVPYIPAEVCRISHPVTIGKDRWVGE